MILLHRGSPLARTYTRAILDTGDVQFDFYHGIGGLDVCYLSFADRPTRGNVGVHKFNGKSWRGVY